MKESLSSRVGRIISGSLNAVVDAVESATPEIVMKEAVREVETAIDDVRAEFGRVAAQKHLATKSLTNENSKYEELQQQADLAVKEERDDLARAAIKKMMHIEAQIPILEKSIAECSEKEKELESYVRALQGKRDDMVEEISNLKEAQEEAESVSATGGESVSGSSDVASKVDKATSAFNRILGEAGLQKKTGDLSSVDESKLAELESLSKNNRIEERLAQLKAGDKGKK